MQLMRNILHTNICGEFNLHFAGFCHKSAYNERQQISAGVENKTSSVQQDMVFSRDLGFLKKFRQGETASPLQVGKYIPKCITLMTFVYFLHKCIKMMPNTSRSMRRMGPEDRKALCESTGAIGTGLPVLEHGDIKMCQSQAIQGYIAQISPKFEKLPHTARGIDLMWAAHMEDFIGEIFASGIGATLFGGAAATDEVKAKVKATMEKWFAHFEKLSPADGFVNKQDFPTSADCVAVYYFYAAAPNKAVVKQSGFDASAYPKFKALADRAAAAPGLKEYIASSTSLPTNPFEKLC